MKQTINYWNLTDSVVIIRSFDIRAPLERIVPPHSQITFEVFSDSVCEVFGGGKEHLTLPPEICRCTELSNEV